MKNKFVLICCFIVFFCYSCNKRDFKSDNLCLNNKKDAIKLAEKEWLNIYGNLIYSKKPFKAELINDSIWVVNGSLKFGENGGVPYAEINAKNCKFIVVTHGK
jgi:hypothetical protein